MTLQTPADSHTRLYESSDEVETPAVLVDLDVMDENMRRYADFADEHDVRLRSHAKTHKTPALAHYQDRHSGGGGIVCQTLSEVEVMAQNGVDNIYLTYMVVGERKLDRLTWIAKTVDQFATTVDGPGNVLPLQEAAARRDVAVDTVLELDPGMGRVGAAYEDAVERAELIVEQPNLNFAGIMAYEGGMVFGEDGVRTPEEYEERCFEVMDEVQAAVEEVEEAGIPVEEVRVGGTATSLYSGKHPVVTEVNPGMYLFNDHNLVQNSPDVDPENCALTVASTVISTEAEDRIVVDAGSKSICPDIDLPPLAREHPDLHYFTASEEHGWVDVSDCEEDFEVGDRIEWVPPHVCTTVNLHDALVGTRGGQVEEVWDIQARGKVR
jgi:D-serine deaminase-like pyridoxal phosphate-dependent protein